MVTFVLWGRKENYPVWQEDVVAEVGTENELDRAKKVAMKEGYTEFRVLKHTTGDKPDFIGAINI